ncbi:hypothetical protein LguiB_021865 [Lonicera macranthoides]
MLLHPLPTFPSTTPKFAHSTTMEALIYQFTLLSDQALTDKSFDPSSIENLLCFFDVESYKAWAAMELEHDHELHQAQTAMDEAEQYLDSAMDEAMAEFDRFEAEMNRECETELNGLIRQAEGAKKMGNALEKAATFASKKYIEAALNSAGASMRSAMKGISSKKVHPS